MSDALATLRRERDELAEEVLQLKEVPSPSPRRFPKAWGLNPLEGNILTAMTDERGMSYERFGMMRAWAGDPHKTLRIHTHRLRNKTPTWVNIETVWGFGYKLDDETRRKMRIGS